MASDPEWQRIEAYLEAGEYEEAVSYAESLNHPLSDSWLQKIHEIGPHLVLQDGEIPLEYQAMMGVEADTHTAASVVAAHEAARRYLNALPNDFLVLSAVIAGVIGLLFIGALKGFGFIFVVALLIALVAFLVQGEEITTRDPVTGSLERRYEAWNQVTYTIQAETGRPLAFAGDLPPPLRHPPSISALQMELGRGQTNERLQALSVIQSSLFALWGWGLIEIHPVRVTHHAFGTRVREAKHFIVRLGPDVTSVDVDGELERRMLTLLERWPYTHQDQLAAFPWKPGPSLMELTHSLVGGDAEVAPTILAGVRDDAIGRGLAKRSGFFKRFEFTAVASKELGPEAHNIQVLIQRMAATYPDIGRSAIKAIGDAIGDIELG